MEPLEAEKASIIAEIEESVGIGKERYVRHFAMIFFFL